MGIMIIMGSAGFISSTVVALNPQTWGSHGRV